MNNDGHFGADHKTDWRIEATYSYAERLTRLGWAWEFLRRNPDFRRDLNSVLSEAQVDSLKPRVHVWRAAETASLLARWGLLFRGFRVAWRLRFLAAR